MPPTITPGLSLPQTPRAARAQVEHEMHRAARAAISPAILPIDDPRWLLAQRTARALQGSALPPDAREKLLHLATRIGLRPFEANMVIALVQDQARLAPPRPPRTRPLTLADRNPFDLPRAPQPSSRDPLTPILRLTTDIDSSIERSNTLSGMARTTIRSSVLRRAQIAHSALPATHSVSQAEAETEVALQNRASADQDQILSDLSGRMNIFAITPAASAAANFSKWSRAEPWSPTARLDERPASPIDAMWSSAFRFTRTWQVLLTLGLGLTLLGAMLGWFFLPPA